MEIELLEQVVSLLEEIRLILAIAMGVSIIILGLVVQIWAHVEVGINIRRGG